MSPEQGKLYLEYLRVYNIEDIEKAVDRAIKELIYFPKISQLINFIAEINEEQQLKQLPWYEKVEEISPDGQQKIQECIQSIYRKWEEEEKIKKQNQEKHFEKRKEDLRKQIKLVT